MKKLYFLLLILTMTTGVVVNAWAQTSKDSTRKLVIDAKGGIHDHGGTKLGYIDKNDIVRNNKGQKLYFIDRDGNVVSADGTKLGKAKKNGDYYNNDGEVVLQLKNADAERCEILDPKGHSQGYVHRNYKLHACAAHCYWLEQAKLKKEKADKAKTK
ncbi:hypothetical protein DIU31_027860 [Mucilaginibacter rubeus]|uniref:DUF3659 domain-containing protein n=1 Tax=Mucilaginibacter rubeus TaxID=2027860 RepID=A0AAE6JKB0_9SPHI|nr:hypothetical protein [Mucilaginibacter rubeus]QEM07135.1 hypothetical protein DIU31_027860 [Mucilaginibacter rubeus]QTE43720.1 hypothetical protein J3L19_33205 [Mucilaginibacter rubeus]QTE50319.1 hypothetical protein J3L21_33160 [Mucilaginibacter rubeus]QTE55406.1 hypothetical protein J3L23_24775 [Mucilaginibacter rubeus]QTE65132.1 hypothetical protein J3L22_09045 [Mucilaginibacter rubeus]